MKTETKALTVSEIIDQSPLSFFQIRTIVLCGLVLVLDGFDAQCIGFLAPSISESQGIPLKTFGPIFAVSLIGLMLAAMAVGPIADRWGRRWTAIFSTVAFASFAILTARANTFNEFLLLRFLTGLGLGGAMPNIVALTAEYSPRRLQSILVATLFCGMPMGALVASLASSVMIPIWGWRSVFYLGGLLPLAIAVVLLFILPESVRFLSVKETDPRRIVAILTRISPELAKNPIDFSRSRETKRQKMPVKLLFTEGRAVGTILLWVPFFMNLLIIYFIVNWLPGLLRQGGMPATAGVAAISCFSFGGIVGSVVQGRLMNTYGNYSTLLLEFGISTLLIAMLSFSASAFVLMLFVTFVLGVVVQGAQAGLNALAADIYPTAIRSTGVGWALGIGRIGSIVGPSLGGILLSLEWRPQQIVLAGVIPALCGAIAVLLSHRRQRKNTVYRLEEVEVDAAAF